MPIIIRSCHEDWKAWNCKLLTDTGGSQGLGILDRKLFFMMNSREEEDLAESSMQVDLLIEKHF